MYVVNGLIFTTQMEWTKERVLRMISYWRQCECLYNNQHKLYSHQKSRQEALETIAKQLRGSMPEITTSDIKTKINYLRSQYCREMHKYKNSNKSGAESDDTYSSCPYWFESMSFLKDFVKLRNYAGKEETPDSSSYLSRDSIDDLSFDDIPKPIKRSRSCGTSSADSVLTEPGVYLYKPDPDILELLQNQIAATSGSQRAASSQPRNQIEVSSDYQCITSGQSSTSAVHTTSSSSSTFPFASAQSTTCSSSEYEETFMSFVRVNMALVTDISLKDELTDKITMLLMEYKGKQRKLDSRQD